MHGQDGKGKAAKVGTSGKGAGQIEAFWQTVVEAGLLSSSHERKYLGMQLFRRMLPALRQGILLAFKGRLQSCCWTMHAEGWSRRVTAVARWCRKSAATVNL